MLLRESKMTKENVELGKKIIHVDTLTKTESSNVASLAYQDKTKTAFVTFKNGSLYEYKNVDVEDFNALMDAESVGQHLNRVFLKKGFEYEKLENTELSYPVLTKEVIEEAVQKTLYGD